MVQKRFGLYGSFNTIAQLTYSAFSLHYLIRSCSECRQVSASTVTFLETLIPSLSSLSEISSLLSQGHLWLCGSVLDILSTAIFVQRSRLFFAKLALMLYHVYSCGLKCINGRGLGCGLGSYLKGQSQSLVVKTREGMASTRVYTCTNLRVTHAHPCYLSCGSYCKCRHP